MSADKEFCKDVYPIAATLTAATEKKIRVTAMFIELNNFDR